MFKVLTALLIILASAFAQATPILLTTANTIVFRGTVDGDSITEAQLQLVKLNKERGSADYPLYLVLDSPGGSIMAGSAFIQFAKTIRNLETISIFAASMASGIVEALPGKRWITDNGIIMFHRAAGQFQGYFNDGEIESELKLFKAIVQDMEQTNAVRLKISLPLYKAKAISEYWLYGREAVSEKANDATATIYCSNELINQRVIVANQDLFGKSELYFSGCPLFRAPLQEKRK